MALLCKCLVWFCGCLIGNFYFYSADVNIRVIIVIIDVKHLPNYYKKNAYSTISMNILITFQLY